MQAFVIWFDVAKRYGFLHCPDTGEELLFHQTDLTGPPPEPGAIVSFEIGTFKGRPKAIKVKPANGSKGGAE
jgi:cold shock CspA family protein